MLNLYDMVEYNFCHNYTFSQKEYLKLVDPPGVVQPRMITLHIPNIAVDYRHHFSLMKRFSVGGEDVTVLGNVNF